MTETPQPAQPPNALKARLTAARRAAASTSPAIPRRSTTIDTPLSPAQAGVWFLAQMDPTSSAYNVPTLLRLRGPLTAESLLEAVRDLAERHTVLRSVIVERAGEPVAVVGAARGVPVTTKDVAADAMAAELRAETERPFALGDEPPMRAVLFRVADDEHVLALTVHHIATDAWSENLMIGELAALYTARLGLAGPPPPPGVQYSDYAAWRATRAGSADKPVDANTDIEWWARRLAGLPPIADLPTDRPRPAVPSLAAAEVPVVLPEPLTDRLRAVAAEHGCTPFMVLLAAWQSLLGRICGTDDVAVAIPESGRHHRDTETTVGCFINTLVIRTDLAGDPAGTDLLRRVRDALLESFGRSEGPFEQVVTRINPERILGATPLCQVQFNMYEKPAERSFPGLTVERSDAPAETAKMDLSLTLVDCRSEFRGEVVYRSELFDQQTATRLAGWYLNLLEGLLADLSEGRDRPVGAIPLDTPAGPLLLGPVRDWPVDRPVHTFIETQVDRRPDAAAVVAPDGVLTYAELDRQANRLAHRLRDVGVGVDTPVGVLLEPTTPLAWTLLGILKAGGAYLPLDTTCPASRITELLNTAGARTLVTVAEFADRAGDRTTLVLDDPATLAGQPSTRPDNTAGPDSLIHVILTSGSTGQPKAVAVSHRSVVNYLHGALDRIGADVAGGSFAMVSTPAADFGLTCVFGALTTGGTLHLVSREVATDPDAFAQYLCQHQVDVVKCVPSHMELLATHRDISQVLPRRLLILAGETCPWALVERVRAARPDLRVQNHYGHTESTMISLVCDTDDVPPERRRGVVPLGTPLANVTGYVVDRAGRPLPAGVPGELILTSPGIARGYLGQPELTSERFVPDPVTQTRRCYRSGDRIRVQPDGTAEFLGRLDDQLKIRGYRVEPGEVVTALRSLPGIEDAVVLAVGEGRGRKLAAWLVGNQLDVGAVRAQLRERLPEYMIPASFVVLDRLPLNSNGKIDRAALPAPAQERPPERTAPRTPGERQVAAAWTEVLGVDDIAVDDDFFTLGGDSFSAIRAIRAVDAGRPGDPALRVIDLFTHSTVRRLAALLDRRDPRPSGLLHHLSRPHPSGPSVATLVCLPYGGGSAGVFQPLAGALAQRGIDLLAVESPGHDPADPDEALIPMADLVDRLAAEVTATISGPVALYGHCVGSAVATALARRLEADGRSVLGVVTAGSFPTARLPGRLSAWVSRVFGDRWVSDRLYRDTLRATGGLLDNLDDTATTVMLRAMRHDVREAEEWFGKGLAGPAGRRLHAPMLCLVGERDRVTELHQERYREWGAFAERVDLVTIPRAGHYFLRHQATELADLLAGRLTTWLAEGADAERVEPAAGRSLPDVLDARRGLRSFYTVAGGQFVSLIGSALSTFALGLWAYQRSGRIFDLALIIMLAQLPAVLATPAGGALADRVDRRRIMLCCDAVSGLTMAALVALVATGRLALPNVCVIVAVSGLVTAFQQPAYLAAIAQLVPKPYLPQANALANLGASVGAVVAPLAGGALMTLLGLPAVVIIDVATFALGVVTLMAVRFPDRLFRRQEESFRAALGGGWRFIKRRRPLIVMVCFTAVANYFNAVLWVGTAPLVLSVGSPTALGLVTAAGGAGAALGGTAVMIWGGTRRRAVGMVAFVIVSGLGTILMGVWPSVGLIALGLAIRWGSMAIGNAHWLSLIQVKVGPELQGRVLAANLLLVTIMEPLGFLTTAPLAHGLGHLLGVGPARGLATLIVAAGVLLTIWGLVGLCYRPLRRMEDVLPDAVPEAEIDGDLDRLQAQIDESWAA
jgi:amino acid adenylation domain-containing protein